MIMRQHPHRSISLVSFFAFLTAKEGYGLSDWIIDSGASLHVSPHKEWFTSYVDTKDLVRLGNEQTCEILGVGDVQLKF